MRTYKTYKKTAQNSSSKRQPVKRARPKNTTPLEKDEQMLLFEWAEYATVTHPELALLYHVANGGYRNRIEAKNLRLQGVRAGVPDMCLPVPRGGYGALYIELKRRKGGRVSEEQRVWIDALNRAGNKAVICKGFDEAKSAIEEYLKGAK